MKFDKQKWDAYVQEQGGVEVVKDEVLKNNLIKHFYRNNEYVLNRLKDSFDPIEYASDTILFMVLGLDITEFILLETVTGIEALRALCDGKILRHLKSDVYYKIQNNVYFLKSEDNNWWQKSYTYIDYILIDEFEVCDAEND